MRRWKQIPITNISYGQENITDKERRLFLCLYSVRQDLITEELVAQAVVLATGDGVGEAGGGSLSSLFSFSLSVAGASGVPDGAEDMAPDTVTLPDGYINCASNIILIDYQGTCLLSGPFF